MLNSLILITDCDLLEPLPKPRAARGSTGAPSEGGLHPSVSSVSTFHSSVSQQHSSAAAAHQHSTSPAQQQQQQQQTGGVGQQSPAGRGKRPVPLPRRLSSVSSPNSSPTSSSSQATAGQPSLRLHASNSLSPSQPTTTTSSSTTQTQQPDLGNPSSRAQLQSRGSNPRRRSTTAEVPTPTANFKSYRRVLPSEVQRRSSCTEEGPGKILSLHHKFSSFHFQAVQDSV